MLTIRYSAAFRRDYKRIVKRGYDTRRLERVIELLAERKPLPENLKDHALSGTFSDFRECHIAPDWLLVYRIIEDQLVLVLSQTGTHSDLFNR
ncbi:type II toxin-antitoxin system RelE/ParE family toxin [Jonquetella anthropi]|uniref:type II toxin-antitoxin system RelE/ParE family toxin n=1 Tax=Jonquetella anthropi TaxID=428712 RepID=UPI0001B911F4|nr:type II toxin-antitoxin system YafQ family toxin [Jonquetella anthropi]EEX47856.1 addiction module toxin, RelE/StbE family [Jonquetella anthropi E3_33 E1]